ncbi:hypothetical protein RJZ56_007904 [Blastomyces dermatitidis]|uniref:Rad60/SUMO-like domain-containing protein n=3 Tax=Blastomyces TaxID=229219 RepID=A0A179UFJ6_BLAGS|nr:uncharacterized protein BDBG_01701 [Blastomyces gilchristii SLH14081]XP_045275802.1 uncharacterized protein BDCG_03854 [Blastomyces dermatitidis ER-3]EGE77095.1 hypothetical protein BDDG_00032 [Blastomyces dermatitidis ATCC 18188]EQL38860.1 hypothetical protein BDFG_00381 [Blastomyces dermatitidis ATCC 26199]EEQ88734.1 hypothetical protein BDCG_03854 [Blastomyces dermatitidis ER-3]OAT05282.1 hypothetical protein BDBG_01701 [Blastomyces gilchristii SLH14081]
MRSFFKKPDWAKPDSNPGQSAEFYRRSEQVYTDIISRKPEVDEKSEDDEDNEEASQHLQDDRFQEPQPSQESRGSKRRRISREESVPSTKCPGRGSEGCEKGREDQADVKEAICPMQRMQQAPATTMSHTQVKNPPAKVNNELPPTATVIELDSSDTGSLRPKSQSVQATQPHSRQAPKHALDDEEDDDDDLYKEEEYAELVRKARERARLQRAASAGNAGPDPVAAGARTTQSPNLNHTTKPTSNTPDRQSQLVEPIVRILITSDLPNTNPLIVQRRLNQDLRDVRRAWCSRQGFDDDMTASVFLTWKGRRLFDVTTCKSLGVLEDKEKGLLQPLPIRDYYNDSDDDGRDSEWLEVHMEAVTEKLFEEKRRQAMKASQGGSGGSDEDEYDDGDNDDDDEDKDEMGRESQEKQNVLLIFLKCPGIEDLKIRVRHKTHISSIIRSFREKRDIPSHRTVQLLFDGDQLHPDSMVSDNDMADRDAIDVRIK